MRGHKSSNEAQTCTIKRGQCTIALRAFSACSLAPKGRRKINGRMGVSRSDVIHFIHVHARSMASGSGLAVSTPRT